jgi:hypothetical protein
LLAKKVEFKWTPACQESFETLKKKLTTALAYHVFVTPRVHSLKLEHHIISIGISCVCYT